MQLEIPFLEDEPLIDAASLQSIMTPLPKIDTSPNRHLSRKVTRTNSDPTSGSSSNNNRPIHLEININTPMGSVGPYVDIPGPDLRTPLTPILSRTSTKTSLFSQKKKREEREVLVGTPIKEGHVNYLLMFDMLTGIRISVGRCNARAAEGTVVQDSDYDQMHKLAFDEAGVELTPRSKYDFKFKDYAPWLFKCIRDAFHVDSVDYLQSLTGKYVLSELGSPVLFWLINRENREASSTLAVIIDTL
jgi:hypothetical protein